MTFSFVASWQKKAVEQCHNEHGGSNHPNRNEGFLDSIWFIVRMHVLLPPSEWGGSATGDLVTDKSHEPCGDADLITGLPESSVQIETILTDA